jgi:hypothetical protein
MAGSKPIADLSSSFVFELALIASQKLHVLALRTFACNGLTDASRAPETACVIAWRPAWSWQIRAALYEAFGEAAATLRFLRENRCFSVREICCQWVEISPGFC